MAVLFFDGFDHYATADIVKKWTSVGASTTISSVLGRRGGGCLVGAWQTSTFTTKTIPASGTVIVGEAVYATTSFAAHSGATFPLKFMETGVTHVSIGINGSGYPVAYNGSGTLLGAGTIAPPANGYFYIEAKVTVHSTAGSVEVRINGAVALSLTNINTRNGGAGVINGINLLPGFASGSNQTYLDDFYICDTSGPDSNDFLGDVRVDTSLANADGTYAQFTPNSGTVHYTRVAETQPDTATYNASGTVGAKDTYQFGDLSSVTGTVKAVQVTVTALKDDAGARSIAPLIKSGSSETQGASTALSTSQTMTSTVVATDPATGAAWTEAGINALEAGVVVTG